MCCKFLGFNVMVMGFAFHASGNMEWKIHNSKNIPIPCKNIPKMEWNGKYHSEVSVFFLFSFFPLSADVQSEASTQSSACLPGETTSISSRWCGCCWPPQTCTKMNASFSPKKGPFQQERKSVFQPDIFLGKICYFFGRVQHLFVIDF